MSNTTIILNSAENIELTKEIKDWFGDGEVDVDLMLSLGIITKEQILKLWENHNGKTGCLQTD